MGSATVLIFALGTPPATGFWGVLAGFGGFWRVLGGFGGLGVFFFFCGSAGVEQITIIFFAAEPVGSRYTIAGSSKRPQEKLQKKDSLKGNSEGKPSNAKLAKGKLWTRETSKLEAKPCQNLESKKETF